MYLNGLKLNLLVIILIYYKYNHCYGISSPLTKHEINSYKAKIVSMFYHSYESYLKYASNYDELQPISCKGTDTWGQFSLSLIDALDTLAVLGNYSEFRRVAQLVIETADFNTNINVSVFETNIRVIGGLLSAHLLSHKAGIKTEKGWPCEGPLLRLAEDAARRLLPAFESKTGMPYGTVNLRYGVPENETPITCTAGVGTFVLEFCTLSRLTGDPIFQNKALKAINALHKSRSKIGLVGNHINIEDGKWTATESGIGGGVDSYYEYLVKGAMLLQMPQLMDIFYDNYRAINKYIKKEDWYVWVSMTSGQPTMPIFQSLEAFWPGVLTLIGDLDQAKKSIYNYHQVWKQYGFTPEFYDIPNSKLNTKRDGYPLRPEFIESVLYLYKATKDPHLLQIGADVIDSIDKSAKTDCGFATIKSVSDHTIEDRMESFFLAETLKYLYLLFDENNFVHNQGSKGTVINVNGKECIIDSGGYIFNTEAHLLDTAAVYCCSNQKTTETNIFMDFQNNLDLYSALDLNDKPINSLKNIRNNYRNDILREQFALEFSNINDDISSDYVIINSDSHKSSKDLNMGSNVVLDANLSPELNEKSSSDLDQTESEDTSIVTQESIYFQDVKSIKVNQIENSLDTKTQSTTTISTSDEVSPVNPLLPTLDSSLNLMNIPNVVKTDSQSFSSTSDVQTLTKSILNDQTVDSISVKETTETYSSKVSKAIEPTNALYDQYFQSKSLVDQQLSEEIMSVLSDNTFINEKLSQQLLQVMANTSILDILVNSTNINPLPTNTSPIDGFNTSLINYELLLCPSQPFLSRLSYFGQMIIYS
ncbi:ER degradation-enhancing alpha-mannosidase-like protein 2 [Oppia nitens]|uniref:ER degradation-enhancing alpha-mannosidase-like protein 2 n=1 Tax=Oppia nitens TaxID=1686743 RepID=UPI0023D98CF1|nr:ER degradation-enhancing alpha-mannosidase-like protein 2 [Oppia nitens]